MAFPPRYPFEPPLVTFQSAVYHPNIDTAGNICLDLLKPLPAGSWKPSIDVLTLLTAVKLLLAEPNPDDPLMPAVAAECREHPDRYRANAQAHTAWPLETAKAGPDAAPAGRSLLKKAKAAPAGAERRADAGPAPPPGSPEPPSPALRAQAKGSPAAAARPSGAPRPRNLLAGKRRIEPDSDFE